MWRIGSGGFVGSVTVMPIPDGCEATGRRRGRPMMFLTYLFVHPLRRGRGWAEELLRAATEWADRVGVDLWLYVRAYGHPRGRATASQLREFYGSHGFRPVDGCYRDEMVRRCRVQK